LHTWVKRGFQTALVTGGLLMLGTGIASASENVNPDTPANPIDAGVSVPFDVDQNNVGTPVGEVDTPSLHQQVDTDDVTGTVSGAVPLDAVSPVTSVAGPAAGMVTPSVQNDTGLPTGDVLRGNKVVARVIVPVKITGNALALGGNASAVGSGQQSTSAPDPVHTDGRDSSLAGNVVGVNWALPIEATGNAIGALGNAHTTGESGQATYTGGNVVTSGRNGAGSGNVVVGQWATPLQLANNAVAGGGTANSDTTAETDAISDGSLRTNGADGTIAGTDGGVPIALPVQLDGNAVGGAGNAHSTSGTVANSQAGNSGASNIDWAGRAAYLVTNGDPSTLSGSAAQPSVTGPVSVDDNAASGIGNTTATSSNTSNDTAGGNASTLGTGSVGSGSVANAPVALPTQAAGNGAAGIGNASSTHSDDVNSNSGGSTYTLGDNSVLSSTTANVPPASAVDVCGDSAGAAGGAVGDCTNDVTSSSGGYTGTSGAGSTGSGTIVQTPVSVPVEGYGVPAAVGGSAASTADEDKQVTSGGTPNGTDDNGTLAANVVSATAAVPAQVFGDSAAVVGNTSTSTTNDSAAVAGGAPHSSGKHATGSGNIVAVPASVPAQVFGATDTVVGNGSTQTASSTVSQSGGDAATDGTGSALSGNVVTEPVDTANQVFGEAGSVVGLTGSETTNVISSSAGGNAKTAGDYGSGSGNVVTAPAEPIIQGQGDSVAGLANSQADSTNVAMLTNGGTADTSGRHSAVSGDVLDVPVVSDPSVYGDAVAALGKGKSVDQSTLTALNGGDSSTVGDGPLSAYNFLFPAEADADVWDTPVGVLGTAITHVDDMSVVQNGDDNGEQFGVPVSGDTLPVNAASVPSGGELAPAVQPQMWSALTSSTLANPTAPATGNLPGASVLRGVEPDNGITGVLPIGSQFLPRI
jgi:hypothetical protein